MAVWQSSTLLSLCFTACVGPWENKSNMLTELRHCATSARQVNEQNNLNLPKTTQIKQKSVLEGDLDDIKDLRV